MLYNYKQILYIVAPSAGGLNQ